MKPKRDYDLEALGVEVLSRAEAEAISHNAQDRESLSEEVARYRAQLAEDPEHPAYDLRDLPYTGD
jgi:hypothetical protein